GRLRQLHNCILSRQQQKIALLQGNTEHVSARKERLSAGSNAENYRPPPRNLPFASANSPFFGRIPIRSAIMTKSARESASILRIILPRCCFTVFSAAPR